MTYKDDPIGVLLDIKEKYSNLKANEIIEACPNYEFSSVETARRLLKLNYLPPNIKTYLSVNKHRIVWGHLVKIVRKTPQTLTNMTLEEFLEVAQIEKEEKGKKNLAKAVNESPTHVAAVTRLHNAAPSPSSPKGSDESNDSSDLTYVNESYGAKPLYIEELSDPLWLSCVAVLTLCCVAFCTTLIMISSQIYADPTIPLIGWLRSICFEVGPVLIMFFPASTKKSKLFKAGAIAMTIIISGFSLYSHKESISINSEQVTAVENRENSIFLIHVSIMLMALGFAHMLAAMLRKNIDRLNRIFC